jgi:hypothetical protein
MTTTITTKDRVLLDVFTTALEGGINYWAHVRMYHWTNDPSGDPLRNPDYEGFEARIMDKEDVDGNDQYEPLIINRETIEEGIDELAKRLVHNDLTLSPYHTVAILELWKIVNAEGNDENLDYDADTADLIVQQGLLGDVIFG